MQTRPYKWNRKHHECRARTICRPVQNRLGIKSPYEAPSLSYGMPTCITYSETWKRCINTTGLPSSVYVCCDRLHYQPDQVGLKYEYLCSIGYGAASTIGPFITDGSDAALRDCSAESLLLSNE